MGIFFLRLVIIFLITHNKLNSILICASFFFRLYLNPKPSLEALSEGKDALHCGVLEHLKSKSSLPTVIPFRHDVFNFLFRNRGSKSNDIGHVLLEKRDFSQCGFPSNWDRIVDSIGDGVRGEFPIKVSLFLSWSLKNHTLQGNSVLCLSLVIALKK